MYINHVSHGDTVSGKFTKVGTLNLVETKMSDKIWVTHHLIIYNPRGY
jgi:hypothetical protein